MRCGGRVQGIGWVREELLLLVGSDPSVMDSQDGVMLRSRGRLMSYLIIEVVYYFLIHGFTVFCWPVLVLASNSTI